MIDGALSEDLIIKRLMSLLSFILRVLGFVFHIIQEGVSGIQVGARRNDVEE